jgi:hypothetical protein
MASNEEDAIQRAANAWKSAAPGKDTDDAKVALDKADANYRATMRAGGQEPRPLQDITGFPIN